jgi:2-hydroxychromene-2-carboxylate isomerase
LVATLDFWFDLGSGYSYPAAMRIEAEAADADVQVRWRPFLLGPIFKALGWGSSPFVDQPVKAVYMWRDLERICAEVDLPFNRPQNFPVRSLEAARLVLVGQEEGWGTAFARAAFRAGYGEGRDIADPLVLASLLRSLDCDDASALARSNALEIKARLRERTDEAGRIGLFGAPSFVTGKGELFWGNDRLSAALRWAVAEIS